MIPPREPQICVAQPQDAVEIAQLWATCTPGSVWTQMGERVGTIYFRRFCLGGHELAVTARLGDILVGACVGTDRPNQWVRAFYREYGLELASAFVAAVAARPSILVPLGSRIRHMLSTRATQVHPAESPNFTQAMASRGKMPEWCCYMSDFFVDPHARGRQIGTLMLQRFCDEMGARGCSSCLTHTTIDNLPSQVAHQRAGFKCVSCREPDMIFKRRIVP